MLVCELLAAGLIPISEIYRVGFSLRNHHSSIEDSVRLLLLYHTRSSATSERQRVSNARLSRLAHWSCTSL